MKKILISITAALSLVMTFIPSALAVNYADYVGSYYTMNSDGEGYAALDIHTCDATSITLDFYRIKNGVVSNTYVFSPGYVQNDAAVIPFTATTASGSTFTGAMTIIFEANGMIKVDIKSSMNVDIYNGILPKKNQSMIPGAASAPAGTTVAAATAAPAAPAVQQEIKIPTQPEINVVLNDNKVSFEKNAGPFIYNDRTYVPLRSVFFEMGINVYWDDYQASDILRGQQITCTKNGTIIQLSRTCNDFGANKWTLKKWIDSNTSAIANETIDIIDQQPLIIDGTSYLPLRVISETLGAHVNWIDSSRTVDIRCDTSNTCWYDKTIIGAMEDFPLSEAQTYITDDYSNVVADPVPYFVPESKFYLFSATDKYGAVKLRIYYGGYIDVFPDNGAAYVPPTPANSEPESIVVDTPADTPAEAPAETPAEAPAETPAETPTETPAEATNTETGNDGETVIFTYDMTQLDDEEE
ncbi:MAG: hypothetical protein IJH37_00660 [Clostridia bacterium]|nr:hypothetical protein [Clostridia bacterium]